MMYLEKTQLLTVSTAHLTFETLENLERTCQETGELTCYPKSHYGYFIYLNGEPSYLEIPNDLKVMLKLAFDEGCNIICFDCDGELVDGFKNYHY